MMMRFRDYHGHGHRELLDSYFIYNRGRIETDGLCDGMYETGYLVFSRLQDIFIFSSFVCGFNIRNMKCTMESTVKRKNH